MQSVCKNTDKKKGSGSWSDHNWASEISSPVALREINIFLFIHLQGALDQSSRSGLQITKKDKFSSLPLTASSSTLAGLSSWMECFLAQELLKYTHVQSDVISKDLMNWKKIKKKKSKKKKRHRRMMFYPCRSLCTVTKATWKTSLQHCVRKHYLSANDLSWVERKADWPSRFFFFLYRGDMMIVQPSLALESPLLLLLPPVLVAKVRLHSGFQPFCLQLMTFTGLQGEKTWLSIKAPPRYLNLINHSMENNLIKKKTNKQTKNERT